MGNEQVDKEWLGVGWVLVGISQGVGGVSK